MKTIYSVLVAVMLVATACDDKDDATTVMSNDEAAEMVASSVASSSGGLTLIIDDAISTTVAEGNARVQACGYSDTSSQTKTNPGGSNVSFNFTYNYNYSLTCTAGVPQSMLAQVTLTGSLDAPRIATNGSGAAVIEVSSLDGATGTYLVNGNFEREGSFTSKIRDQNSSQSTVNIVLNNIEVNKTTAMITAGEGTITIAGSVSGKGEFSYTGSIVFMGNKQVEIDVNGSKYSMNLETGDVTAI